MPKSKIFIKSSRKTPQYTSKKRKSTTLKKTYVDNSKTKQSVNSLFSNRGKTALQRSFRKTNDNSKRLLSSDVQNKYTNYKFNALFHSDTIYEMIIHNIKTSIDNQPLYYCNVNVDKKNIIPNSYPKIWNQLLGHGYDGHYLVRLTSQKVAGHAVCIYKQNNEYTLYDSNDYSRSEFAWFGTSKLAKAIETQNNIFVTSGYETYNNKPMLENICTLFALYTWLFEPVPQRDVLANVNSESAKMYIQYLLMKIKEKFDEYNNHDEMKELSINMDYIISDEQLYN